MKKYKFVLERTKEDKYHWMFVGPENEVVSVSETYDKKQDAMNAIGIVNKFATSAEVYDLTGEE